MRHVLVSAIALALAGLTAPASAQDAPAAASARLATTQLPRDVRPTHYAIFVAPHADKLAFDGKVAIDVDVLQATDRIVLNALDMTFGKVELRRERDGDVVATPKMSIDAAAQTAAFAFDAPLQPGKYVLSIEYAGKINTQANGLFAIDYENAAGKQRALFTQFEAPDARRFVPSWDEPSHKATFDLTATVPSGQMAVSNMPAAETKDVGNGLSQVRFQTSPKMSTYLLFFALGDFDRITTRSGKTEIGVVAQKGAAEQGRFALESSAEVLREYNDYFGVDYPLPKLDNIASPGQSQFFAAMENWGAILTFEYALLMDPTISTLSDKQGVFSIAAHEIAHQWFGDLVTMSWWDDLWLNEGFASWMASRTTQKLHPEWNTRLGAVFSRNAAMSRDAVATTHPVVQKLETVEQIGQAFDAITYSKGQAVITMIENYVGEDAWRTGVRNYIKAHAYGNTVSSDLWSAIQSAAGKPVLDIAHDFTEQPGIPLIQVASATCEGGNTTLQLTQGEFTKDRPGKTPLSWRVPVIASVAGSGKDARAVVQGGKGTMQVPGCGPVVVNAGQTGYYRTLYAAPQFAQLRDGFATLDAADQIGILQDAWALGMAGRQNASDYLDLAAKVPVNGDPQVWGEIAGSLGSIDAYYEGDEAARAKFRTFAIATLAPVFANVGWEARAGEPDPVKNLRTTLIGVLGGFGDEAVLGEARRRFAAAETDPAAMPADLRKTIMGIVAYHADAATWDKLHAAAKVEKTPLVKDLYYNLLAAPRDEALARRALDLAMSDEPTKTIGAGMIAGVSGSHPDMAYDYALAHYDAVSERVDASTQARYFPALANGSLDAAMPGKLRAFAQAHVPENARQAVETSIANIEYRRSIVTQRLPQITRWLQQHGG